MISNIYAFKPYKDLKLQVLAVWLKKHRVSANMITLVGLVCGINAAVFLLAHQIGLGLGLLGLSIGMDVLDGTVARLEKITKISGKFLDAICDRVVELAWIGALILTGALNIWGLSLALGSIMLFVCRILAYRCGVDSSAVFVTRFERMVAMFGIVILPWRMVALVIYLMVTIGTYISGLQIMKMLFVAKTNLSPGNNEP